MALGVSALAAGAGGTGSPALIFLRSRPSWRLCSSLAPIFWTMPLLLPVGDRAGDFGHDMTIGVMRDRDVVARQAASILDLLAFI